MLGSLARKLRIFGFDTEYFRGDDRELERLARKEGRVILTADRALAQHAKSRRQRAILIEGKTDGARLTSLRKQLGPHRPEGPGRCAVCNGELASASKAEVSARVPPSVLARHRSFYRCESCDRLYWKGGHWRRLRRLSYAFTKD